MEHQTLVFAGILLAFVVSVFTASVGDAITSLAQKSSEVIPIDLVECSNTTDASYQCVRIEDCKARRRRGSRQFCKWEGKPTHVCCPVNRLKESSARQKRYDSYFDRDFLPSRRFYHRSNGWKQDDYEDYGEPCDYPRHHVDRFFHHNHHRDRDYNKDFETFDNSESNHFHHGAESECGVLAEEERWGRITSVTVKGSVPVKTSSPWMVAIGRTLENGELLWFCGGSLISKKIILTAAHCIEQGAPDTVRVGELNPSSNADALKHQDSEIESSVIHPDHKPPHVYHDIAIVKLKTPVRYSKYMRPVCLPPNDGNLYENVRTTLTGFGKIENVGRVVQEVSEISVMSNSQCNAKYGFPAAAKNHNRTLPRGIISSQLCARNKKESGRDACDGDSGGPIVVKKGRRRVLIGIVSSGRGCSSDLNPAIYTRVSSYTDWIRRFF